MQSFSSDSGHVSPHWIAYGLMDSIVDEFFPVLEFIEDQSDELEEYLLDPLSSPEAQGASRSRMTNSRQRKQDYQTSKKKYRNQMTTKIGSRSKDGERMRPKPDRTVDDRSAMLSRITFNRRLVVSLGRLIAQKHQTVAALRKRVIDDDDSLHDSTWVRDPKNPKRVDSDPNHRSKEIGLYLGDLQDHILSLTQALSFYDTLLSNAHSTYLGILRVGLNRTKHEQDEMIIRLYLITLIVLPMNTLIGLHSMNIHIPANGDQNDHLEADRVTPAPFNVFWIILFGCLLLGFLFILFIWFAIIRPSQIKFNRPFPKFFYFL